MLRARDAKSRWEASNEKGGEEKPAAVAVAPGTIGSEQEALLADSVGLALLVVFQTLAPGERVAFVLTREPRS